MNLARKVTRQSSATEPKIDIHGGGRHLKAISHIVAKDGNRLRGTVQAVLRAIGSYMDYNFWDRGWYMSVEVLSFDTGFGVSAVKEAIREAEAEGVLKRTSRRYMGKKAPTYYELTPAAFEPYQAFLEEQLKKPNPFRPAAAPKAEEDPPPDMPGPFDEEESLRPPAGHSPWPPAGHNTMAASRPKAPKCPKSNSPVVPPLAERRLLKEAEQIGEQIFMPVDRSLPFVSRPALHATMLTVLKRFGIETIRTMRDQQEARGLLGFTQFNANATIGTAERIYNEAKKNPTTLAEDLLARFRKPK